ncbi:MAG: serine protease [Rhizobacter sp.]
METIERNRNAGDLSEAARTYWMPPVAGPEVTLEVQIPRNAKPSDVQFSLPTLSHLFADATQSERERDIGDALECNLDVTCAGSAYDQESAATVQLKYVENGSTYSCTGTTLAAADNSTTPYLLTANHCFNNQTVASTLISTFFLRSTTCNALTSRTTARLTTGATWLYSSSEADTTFVRLNSPMPAGSRLAGWATSVQSSGTGAFGLHHPMADLQLYSIGSIDSYRNCSAPNAQGEYSCTSAAQSNSKFYAVKWTQGVTEGGSSGSALWATIGGSRYVVGSLRGGSSTCTKAAAGNYLYTGIDTYGRFDVAYNAALKRWLSPAAEVPPTSRSVVYRFYNASTGAHFYTTSAAERDFVIASLKEFAYEGVAFYAYAAASTGGTSPIYRFYNRRSGSHFYTISAAEKDWVIATLKDFTYEGSAWNGQMAAGGTAVPIYRFFNATRGTHFFTINENEKNIVLTNPSYKFEGVAYYGWTTP